MHQKEKEITTPQEDFPEQFGDTTDLIRQMQQERHISLLTAVPIS